MKVCSRLLIFFLLVSSSIFAQATIPNWAHVHKKVFTLNEQEQNDTKTELVFSKHNVDPFSQLIFAWNAFRPSDKGYFSFHAKVRNAQTKKWGTWHRMVHWGAGIQRSFQSKSDGFSRFEHVRLETDGDHLADAFSIKIQAHGGASLADVHAFSVTTADLSSFKAEAVGSDIKNLDSVHVPEVQRISQFKLKHEDNHRMCSPTSATMLTNYFIDEQINPLHFAADSYDSGLGVYGSWPLNTAHAFDMCGGSMLFYPTRLNSFVELHGQLDRGIPVVVSVRGKLPGAPKAYANGHLLVVVGWDRNRQEVICHDPAFKTHKNTLKRYPIRKFLRAWELSKRLVYWAEPVFAYPDLPVRQASSGHGP